MSSLHELPVEVLLLVEYWAKEDFDFIETVPALQLSWVCRQLRAVFMPRFWSFLVIERTASLARLATLIRSSPKGTYRELVKYLNFGAIGGGAHIDARLYTMDPTPSAGDQLPPDHRPVRMGDDFSVMCGPRVGETWPAPIQLAFNDPKRYFKLAGRRRERDVEDESDETGSSAASEAEEEERKCTECHPVMHKLYRHRVKPDDYWLPGAVHSIGPLEWKRRTWRRYKGPDGTPSESPYPISTVEGFIAASTFILDELNIEALEWTVAFPLPRALCEHLAQHQTFHKLGIWGSDGGQDCFSRTQAFDALLLLAPKITVFQETNSTIFGAKELALVRSGTGRKVYRPLTDYPEGNSMRGFMDFLLATKQLKHLNAECTGVFVTPCLLSVFAKLHSLHWDTLTSEPDEHVVALSKLRTSLWQLAKTIGRPDHMLETADVQLLADSDGERADIAANVSALSAWLEQEELAALVAQGWNEQEERGPNESPLFHPPCLADSTEVVDCSNLTSVYENPESNLRY